MTPLVVAELCTLMVATSLLSGVFGMAGGLVLIGVLLAMLPVPEAMALHAVTQMASNAWRGALWWRHIRWRIALVFIAGSAVAMLAWSVWQYVPNKAVALLMLGITPFLARALPQRLRPNCARTGDGLIYGAISMTLLLLTGVSGPLLDTFFLGGTLDRKQIIATKAAVQVFGHAAKLVYFGVLIPNTASLDPVVAGLAIAAAMLGTTLSARLLEMLTDLQYRLWANRMITGIALYYIAYGGALLGGF
eukprot:gene5500-5555_t